MLPTPRSYFLAYDIGDGAEAGASVGAQISDLSWITVSNPNVVSPIVKQIGIGCDWKPYPYRDVADSDQRDQAQHDRRDLVSRANPAAVHRRADDDDLDEHRPQSRACSIKLSSRRPGSIETNPSTKGAGRYFENLDLAGRRRAPFLSPRKDTLIGSVLNAGTTTFTNGVAYVNLNGANGQLMDTTQRNLFVTVDVGATSGSLSTKNDLFGLKIASFTALTFVPFPQSARIPTINFASFISNQTTILDSGSALVPPVNVLPVIWADPFGDGYPSIDVNGVPKPRTYDGNGIPMVDIDGDGINDIILDSATGLPGIDLDGDGLIEIDMNHSGKLSVDFNNDAIPDCVMPDQNGDGVPEIDLSCDGNPDFGYIPEKWSKDTSRLYAKWGKVNSASLDSYDVGIGYNNMSNGITAASALAVRDGKILAKDNSFVAQQLEVCWLPTLRLYSNR